MALGMSDACVPPAPGFSVRFTAPGAPLRYNTREPGRQPSDGRRKLHGYGAHPRPRRVGARLLPEVPEPQARVHRRLLERRQLGSGKLYFVAWTSRRGNVSGGVWWCFAPVPCV